MKHGANSILFGKLLTRLIGAVAIACLIGVQFLGIVHEFNHGAHLKITPTVGVDTFSLSKGGFNALDASHNTKPSEFEINTDSIQSEFSFGHNASDKDCQLFNGLALSSVVASGIFILALFNIYSQGYVKAQTCINLSSTPCPYSAQAPPGF